MSAPRHILALHALTLLAAMALAATPAVQEIEHALYAALLPGNASTMPAHAWAQVASAVLALTVAQLVAYGERRLGRRALAFACLGVACLLLGLPLLLLATASPWISPAAPLLVLALSPLAWSARQIQVSEVRPSTPSQPTASDDRLLALGHRAEGRLDLALEHLRRCPIDRNVLDDMYQLGLEFERRRHFARAQEVFDFILRQDSRYKDLIQRTGGRDKAASEARRPGAAPVAVAGAARPGAPRMLGHYELGRELGRGAMAVVYGGRDTSTNRPVAIKVMPLSSEFEADELETVKRRFFGEAESAGRLEHPNIVKVFAAAEEQGLAYIVMELLTGADLSAHARRDALLPLATVLRVAACVADALDYAHARNVVHRDIKPANIMYDGVNDIVKVTDFGIARITDSNKTKTGMVLGTPSFMSPEQLAGRKIDGQSDLYSLGVTIYQLLCGVLPFEGKSLAQLMYKISNEAPRDARTFNPALSDDVVQVIEKALAKDKSERFATGADMAAALRASARRLTIVDLAL